MVDPKKPKIDLKARLARPQAGATPAPAAPTPVPQMGGSRPPAVGAGMPMPRAGGVPAPFQGNVPFQGSAPGGSPFAGAAAAAVGSMRPAAAVPQTIRVEMDDAVVRAHTRSGKKMALVAFFMAIVAGGLGFAFGGRSSDAQGAQRALEGAQDLIGDIDKSQAKIKDLNDKIGAAIKTLKDKKYPDSFAADLGGLSIPFGSDKLAGKNIGRFDPKTLVVLFKYTNQVEQLNDRKDALKNLVIGQKAALTELLAVSEPKLGYAVYIQKSAKGPLGILTPINVPDRFSMKDNWPPKIKVSNGQSLIDADRYVQGDVFSTDKKTLAIPLDQGALAASFPSDVLVRILGELAKTATVLGGGTNSAGEEEAGLIQTGDQLLVALRNIGKK